MTDQTIKTLRSLEDFQRAGLLSSNLPTELADVEARYAIAMTPHVLARVETASSDDPVLRQYLPDLRELNVLDAERVDPIGDKTHSPVQGIVHRYPDRVLLKVTPVCPVYCRFCFRREMVGPGKDAPLSQEGLAAALAYIQNNPDIWEVILTGGDPFMLSLRRIEELVAALNDITHVKIIRWHTRMPVADPDRIDEAYVNALNRTNKSVVVVVHANHANEFSPAVRAACKRMRKVGIALRSQSVLLKDVNDSLEAMGNLMRTFLECGIHPYYLHQLDYAPGTSHFRVDVEVGQKLLQDLRDKYSGLCIPHFVIDIPGGVSKANISASDLKTDGPAKHLRGRDGNWHAYE